jgi:hypothetical protein
MHGAFIIRARCNESYTKVDIAAASFPLNRLVQEFLEIQQVESVNGVCNLNAALCRKNVSFVYLLISKS